MDAPRLPSRSGSEPKQTHLTRFHAAIPRHGSLPTPPGVTDPALIVGSGPRVVITVARSLWRRGISVIVVVPTGQEWKIRSRAIAAVVPLEGTDESCAAQLVALARLHRASWIVPCSDTALELVARAYDELAATSRVATPPHPVIRRVLDKHATLAAAAGCGVPVPVSHVIDSPAAAAAADPAWFPLVAKPADKESAAGHTLKVAHFATRDDLVRAFDQAPEFGRSMLFQEFCPGTGVGIELLLHRGRVAASFQHRRMREFPATGGVAVVARAEPVDPVLLGHSTRLLEALGWNDGVAMVEFRHDPASGRAVLMEVNGRFWGSLPLAIRAGVDFPWLAWSAARGDPPVQAPAYRSGTTVRWTAGSLLRLQDALRAARTGRRGISRRRAWADFVADFRPGIRSALWSSDDPFPAIGEPALVAREWLRDISVAVIGAIVPPGAVRALRTARTLEGARRRRYLARQCARAARLARPEPIPERIGSVMFVCHGNIMRSAAAAALLRRALAERGVTGISVGSSGVYARAGKPADPRMRRAVRALGVSLDDHAARPLTADLVETADVIFAMDDINFIDIVARFPTARPRVRLLGGIRPGGVYADKEILDPYTGTAADVDATVERLDRSIAALAEALESRRARGGPDGSAQSAPADPAAPVPLSAR